MFSLFPNLLSYEQVAPLLIRMILAAIFLTAGYSKIFKSFKGTANFFRSIGIKPAKFWTSLVGILELGSGTLLAFGFLTQVAALIITVIMLVAIIKVKRKEEFLSGYALDLLILASALSLLVLGPGIFSVDLPL